MRNLLPTLLLLSACSSSYDLDASTDTDVEVGAPSDTGSDDLDFDPDTEHPPADSMALDGTLVILDGAINHDQTDLTLAMYAGTTHVCTASTLVAQSTPEPATAAEQAAAAWWSLTLTETPDGSGCAAPLPLALELGVLPRSAALEPAADSAGLSDDDTNAFSAALQLPDQPDAWLFGLLGTDDQLAGDTDADASQPLADGSYELTTLYLLPAPDGANTELPEAR